jgi:hypothetical protein
MAYLNVSGEKNTFDLMISAIQQELPADAQIQWNGHSYTVLTSQNLDRNDLTAILDKVSRTFWDHSSAVFLSRPDKDYNAIAWAAEPVDGGKGGKLPTFLIGEAYHVRDLTEEQSLSQYTFRGEPILRRDDIAKALQNILTTDDPSSKVLWNGRGYTIFGSAGTAVSEEMIYQNLGSLFKDTKLTYNAERVFGANGRQFTAVTFYRDVPTEIWLCP